MKHEVLSTLRDNLLVKTTDAIILLNDLFYFMRMTRWIFFV